jgi:hypothetical protein
MRYYVLKPEVAGGIGPNTIFTDRTARPPLIERLHFVFSGWLGDPLLTAVGLYVVTRELQVKLQEMGTTGSSFADVEISTSEEFKDWELLHPERKLPPFVWLQIVGTAGADDFGYTTVNGHCMVVSERVLDLFIESGMKHCKLVELENWQGRIADNFRLQK